MKKSLKTIRVEKYEITRFIEKNEMAIQKWGKIWFKFSLANRLMFGKASANNLHAYLPKKIMREVKKNWPEDFKK